MKSGIIDLFTDSGIDKLAITKKIYPTARNLQNHRNSFNENT
jgi:hypothetical protein